VRWRAKWNRPSKSAHTIDVAASDGATRLRATGTVTLFDGFLKLYQEGRDDDAEGEDGRLPKLAQGDACR
jgi:DNA topoisomerase-1